MLSLVILHQEKSNEGDCGLQVNIMSTPSNEGSVSSSR